MTNSRAGASRRHRSRSWGYALCRLAVTCGIAATVLSPGLAQAKGGSSAQRWGTGIATYQCPAGLPGSLAQDSTALTYFRDCMQSLAVARLNYSPRGSSPLYRPALNTYLKSVRWLAPRVTAAERAVAAEDAYWKTVLEDESELMRDRLRSDNPVPIQGVTTNREVSSALQQASSCAFPLIVAIPASRIRNVSKSEVVKQAWQPCLNAVDDVLRRNDFPVSSTHIWRAVFGPVNLNQW